MNINVCLLCIYRWPMFPQTINAMYQFYENEIGKYRTYKHCERPVIAIRGALFLYLALTTGARKALKISS